MSQIVPHSVGEVGSGGDGLGLGAGLSGLERRSLARGVSRQVARTQAGAIVRTVQVDVEAVLADRKIRAVVGLGMAAQSQIAGLSAVEGELTKAVPLAGNRLEMIGNLTTVNVSEIVTDAVAKLRRV